MLRHFGVFVFYDTSIKRQQLNDATKREVRGGQDLGGHSALDTWENTMGIALYYFISDTTLALLDRRTTV